MIHSSIPHKAIWQKLATVGEAAPLKMHACHVWLISLSENPQTYRDLLSTEEQARAGSFISRKCHDEFIVARGFIRQCLGHYLGSTPEKLRLATTKEGKPYLIDYPELHFNLSHSGEHGLFAVTSLAPVGVDLEQVRDSIDTEGLVHRFFSTVEYALFRQLSQEVKSTAFFKAWCAKEALLKAYGLTLVKGLKQWSVQWGPGGEVRKILGLDKKIQYRCDLSTIPGFESCCAVLGNVSEWHCYTNIP